MSLDRYLEEWAREEARAEAPPAAEDGLRLALAERRQARARRQWAGAAAVGVVAVAVAAVGAGLWGDLPVRPRELPVREEAPQVVSLPPAIEEEAAPDPVTVLPRPRARRRFAPPGAGPAAAAAPPAVGAPLWQPVGAWQAVEPIERGLVVRVRLPRATLATLGMPVNAERVLEPIPAELLLGEDGTVRAVRMVPPIQ